MQEQGQLLVKNYIIAKHMALGWVETLRYISRLGEEMELQEVKINLLKQQQIELLGQVMP